ncbi:hypothetical protein [Amycolatopsis sp. VC5-11]|uniref:hypothetical protein n=1 Tax=Amycolatopsis sp. VC5-11 TaxID=3120156 RepID=UPI00300BE1A5
MWTNDDALKQLAVRGFHGIPLTGSPGHSGMILLTRAWDEPFRDQVVIRGADEATACRVQIVDGVDVPRRKDCVWYSAGTVVEVADEITFHLPHPGNPHAPRSVIAVPDTLALPPGVRADVHA